ncbi:DUF3265 domain-containing protein [Vibrio cidicii]|nr:DUF3265 domain-containing protein [Vibrio cidicii]
MTICLRGILNAWHFYYALRLVFKVHCGKWVEVATLLTQR